MEDLARIVLLLLLAVALWNLARGSLTQWLRAKFLGDDLRVPASAARRRT